MTGFVALAAQTLPVLSLAFVKIAEKRTKTLVSFIDVEETGVSTCVDTLFVPVFDNTSKISSAIFASSSRSVVLDDIVRIC